MPDKGSTGKGESLLLAGGIEAVAKIAEVGLGGAIVAGGLRAVKDSGERYGSDSRIEESRGRAGEIDETQCQRETVGGIGGRANAG